MDPYDEQTLREEVLYLHSLWLKGPPTQQQQQQQQQQPPLHLPPSFSPHGLSNPHQIKKKRPRKKTRDRGYLKKAKDLQFEQEIEWPVNPTSSSSPASVSGWPKASSESNSVTLLPSPEEQARFLANRVQLKALNAAQDFLSSDDYDDDDDDDELEEEDEYMDDDIDDFLEEKDGCKEYRFFYSLFMEDGGLKEYYLKNYSTGEFNCLVCGGTLKKFKDCVALVQHSSSISKKRRAHRAYGQAICKLLGWEIDNLPKIISDLTAMVKESSDKSSMGNAEAQETNAVLMPESVNIPNNNEGKQDEHQKKESGDNGNAPNNGDSVISEEEPLVETSVFEGESKDDAPGDA